MSNEVFYPGASFISLGLQAYMTAGAQQLWDQQLQGAFYVSREGEMVQKSSLVHAIKWKGKSRNK